MADPRHVSPCCGAECEVRPNTSSQLIRTRWYACSVCHKPCDPMPADVRKRIVREGMERAAKMADTESHRAGAQGYSGEPKFTDMRCLAVRIRAAMEDK